MRHTNRRIADRIVIALPGSTRLEGFFARAASEGFRVHRAFDGRARDTTELFNAERFADLHGGRPPLGGEVGCTLSHLTAVSEFAAGEGSAEDVLVVAEDDARLSRDFERILRSVVRSRHLEVAILADPSSRAGIASFNDPAVRSIHLSLLAAPIHRGGIKFSRLGHFAGPVRGTGLYVITRAAAQKYSEFTRSQGIPYWTADGYAIWARRASIDVKFLRPNLADFEGGSVINEALKTSYADLALEWGAQRKGALNNWRHRFAIRTRTSKLAAAIRIGARDAMGRPLPSLIEH